VEIKDNRFDVLDQLASSIFEDNKRKGFWETPEGIRLYEEGYKAYQLLKKAEKIALIHSEVSECLEGVRKPQDSDHIPGFTLEEEEMADALIRIFDYCGGFGLRLAKATEAKLEFNRTRPHKHGKNF
jgi:NTP pyrophosphatase (non-canonical NTP hydrolase)